MCLGNTRNSIGKGRIVFGWLKSQSNFTLVLEVGGQKLCSCLQSDWLQLLKLSLDFKIFCVIHSKNKTHSDMRVKWGLMKKGIKKIEDRPWEKPVQSDSAHQRNKNRVSWEFPGIKWIYASFWFILAFRKRMQIKGKETYSQFSFCSQQIHA